MNSASEFVALRTSSAPSDCYRAAHESAPDEVWRDVVINHPEMAQWVAHNKTISTHMMEFIAQHGDVNARMMIAMKGKCPIHVLEMLAFDDHESVRNAVALNRKSPLHILLILANDEWETCASNATRRIAMTK